MKIESDPNCDPYENAKKLAHGARLRGHFKRSVAAGSQILLH
jgi:hypothetical protein